MSKNISFEDAYAHAVTEGIKILGPVVSKIVTYLRRNPTSVE
jgi:hypothetical protein